MNVTTATKRIGDLALKITKGTTPTTLGYAFTDAGVNFIKVEAISSDGRFISDKFSHISNDANTALRRSELVENDILFSIAGAIGRTALVTKEILPANINQAVALIRPNTNIVNPKFLALYLQQEKVIKFANSIVAQSVQANINLQQLSDLEIPVLTLTRQGEIVSVLTAINEKLGLLEKQNETLEKIAQTIFNERFVNKIDTDNLPTGWKMVRVRDVAEVTIGRTPPRKEKEWFSLNPADHKWISIKDLGGAGMYIDSASEYLTPEAVRRFRVPIIPKGTVVVSFKLTVGRVAIATEDMYSNEAIAHIKTHTLPMEYTYLYFKSFDYDRLGSTSSIATATNSEGIRDMEVLIPDQNTLSAFTETVAPLFAKIRANTESIKNLSFIRDVLLPRLMSGELSINI